MIHKHIINQYNIKPCGVIHIGAHIGEEIEHYIDIGIKKLIYIEANYEVMDALKNNVNKYKNKIDVEIYNFAITDKKGLFDFYVTNNLMSSSLYKLKLHKKYYPDVFEAKTIKVFGITFDDFIIEYNINISDYNILVMDIQGAELNVLKGATKNINNFEMIVSEISREEIYDGGCLHNQLTEFLEGNNFKMLNFFENQGKPNDDAIYISRRILDASRQ